MKYIGMPFAVWHFFCASFERNLPTVFGISKADAKSTMAKAKEKYKEIIGNLPEFEKGDRFQMNIVGCAMLAAVALNMPERPKVEILTEYYRNSMMTGAMKWFWETIIQLNPEYMFVLDRSAAIGANDEGLLSAKEVIENDLIKELDVYKEGKIVYLAHVNVWYTSTGGVQALNTMLADLESALLK